MSCQMLNTKLTSAGSLCRAYIQAWPGCNHDQIEKLLSKLKHPSLNSTYSTALGVCASNETVDIRFT